MTGLRGSESISGSIDWNYYSPVVREQVEINIKYAGYLARQDQELKHINQLDRIEIPYNLNFSRIPGLSREVIEILDKLKPENTWTGKSNKRYDACSDHDSTGIFTYQTSSLTLIDVGFHKR